MALKNKKQKQKTKLILLGLHKPKQQHNMLFH